MAFPSLPATIDAEFEADGFRCALRANEALVTLPTLRWLGLAAVLTTGVGMLAVGPVSPVVGLFGLLMWPCLLIGMLYGGGKLLNVLLAAPRTTRIRCTHEVLTLEILVHGMLRDDLRIPLTEVEDCRLGGTGLEIVRRVGGRREVVEVPSVNAVVELQWVAAMVEQAARRRAEFEADERSPERTEAREAAQRLLLQGAQVSRSAGTGIAGPPGGSR